jgi:hypothetical protein
MKHHHPIEAQEPRPVQDAVHTLYSRSCLRLGAQGLKARQVIAQGNALGTAPNCQLSPVRAAQIGWVQGCSSPVKPIQGNLCVHAYPSICPIRPILPTRRAGSSRRSAAKAEAQRRRKRSEGGSAAKADSNFCKPLKRTQRNRKEQKRTEKDMQKKFGRTHRNTPKHSKTHP